MRERGSTASTVISVVALIIAVLLVMFFWRVGVYYFAIKSGDVSKLPQFSSQFTLDPESADTPSAKAERALVESDDDPSFGAEDARLVIVEFLDYECPFSRQSSDIVRSVVSRYADRVKLVIRDYPLNELHPNALLAAEALGCAQEQGVFWPMHDRAFANSTPLARAVLDRIAEQSGADMEAFTSCMSSHRRLKEIEEDIAAATATGIRGTPTFFFNGQRVEGSIPESMFEALIKGFVGE